MSKEFPSGNPKEWTALVRGGKIYWDPNQALPLQSGDIWLYRVDEDFALGFVGHSKEIEHRPPITMILANFECLEAMVTVINYLTGKGPKDV